MRLFYWFIMLPQTIGSEGIMLSGSPDISCWSVNTYFAWCNISLLSAEMSQNSHKCSSCEWALLQRSSRSKVKGQAHYFQYSSYNYNIIIRICNFSATVGVILGVLNFLTPESESNKKIRNLHSCVCTLK